MPKKFRVIKMRTECVDSATGLTGTVTHWLINMEEKIDYLWRPKGLDGEGQPLNAIAACAKRLKVADNDFEEVDIPFEILGTEVTDTISEFTGIAIGFLRHVNGCLHVYIQPQGELPGKKGPIERADFDLRGCTGPMITQLSEPELKESEQKNPSPDRKYKIGLI